jgi:tetratricopeptide (TPR) repeat protein
MHNLAITCRVLGRRDEAESLYRGAIQIIEQAAGPHDPTLVPPLTFLGVLYLENGRVAQAEPFLTRALQIGEVLGPNHLALVPSLSGMAAVRRLRGDFDGARRSATRALRILESESGPEDLRAVGILYELGLFEFETGRFRNAATHWERALAIARKRRGPDHPETLNILVQLGDIAAVERRYKEAEALFLQVSDAAKRPETAAVLGVTLHHLAVLYASRNQHDRSEPLYRRSLAVTEAAAGKMNTEWAACAGDFGRTLFALKRTAEAEAMTRSAVAIAEQTSGLGHPTFLKVLEDHARILRKLNRKEEARQVEGRVRALVESAAGASSRHTVSVAELKASR